MSGRLPVYLEASGEYNSNGYPQPVGVDMTARYGIMRLLSELEVELETPQP
jgi:hypothetical protein